MPKKQMPKTLQLVRGNAVLGSIEVKPAEPDSPWYSGAFKPSAEFETARELFEQELRMLRANTNDDSAQWDEWEAVHEVLHEPGLWLQAPDQSYRESDILIHIDGAEAWWRIE